MNNVKISVVMTTYNGSLYVKEQLESIYNQTLLPDELVVCDDNSNDETISVVKNIVANGKIPNKIIVNKENVGWKKNFINGINICNGDLIFLADQDDIWEKTKIEEMSKIMENDDIEVLGSNTKPFYETEGLPKVERFKSSEKIKKIKVKRNWLTSPRQGCTMCFKRKIIKCINEIWFENCAHDLAIWAISIPRGKAYLYYKELTNFRRHEGNNTPKNDKNICNRVGFIDVQIELANRYMNSSVMEETLEKDKKKIRKIVYFYKKRRKNISRRSYFGMLLLLFKIGYFQYYRTWFGDIISMRRK